MDKNNLSILLLIVWTILQGSCSTQPIANFPPSYPYPGFQELPSGDPRPILVQAPIDAPQPSPGRASISGVLYSYTMSRVLPQTMFYLTRAVGDDNRLIPAWLIGPQPEKGDIRGWTDAYGQFTLNDIPPGNYYLIVWSPYDWIPANNTDNHDLTPRLIVLEENQKKLLGIVYVSWP